MQLEFTSRRCVLLLPKALAGVLSLLVVWLGLLSAGLHWHESLHHDAEEEEHQCVITLFAHGKVDAVDSFVPVALPAGAVVLAGLPAIIAPRFSPAFLLLPERAPPVLS